MQELEMRNYLIQKLFDLRAQKDDLTLEADYQSRRNSYIRSRRDYLLPRIDFLEEILEELNIDISEFENEEVL